MLYPDVDLLRLQLMYHYAIQDHMYGVAQELIDLLMLNFDLFAIARAM